MRLFAGSFVGQLSILRAVTDRPARLIIPDDDFVRVARPRPRLIRITFQERALAAGARRLPGSIEGGGSCGSRILTDLDDDRA